MSDQTRDEALHPVILDALRETVRPTFEKVLNEALNPKRPSYGRREKTLIEEVLEETISREVRSALHEIINERKDEIRQAARERFEAERDTIVDQFIQQGVQKLGDRIFVSISVEGDHR